MEATPSFPTLRYPSLGLAPSSSQKRMLFVSLSVTRCDRGKNFPRTEDSWGREQIGDTSSWLQMCMSG